jgi:hypothetical protein
MKDLSKDIPPSLVKTVRRVVQAMKDLFFKESHDNIRYSRTALWPKGMAKKRRRMPKTLSFCHL